MLKKVTLRFLMLLSFVVIYLFIFLLGSAVIVYKGGFNCARDLVTVTLMETSAAKFVPKIFLTNEEIENIISENTVRETYKQIDQSLINVDESLHEKSEIEIKEVNGATFKGKMLIINDPKRLYVATPFAFETESGGLKVEEMVKRDKAVAGINGGGFEDINGVGNGGKPIGYVIRENQLVFGTKETVASLVGFDNDGKLMVGRMSAGDALKKKVKWGITFDPIGPLIINGEPLDIKGTGGGLNPRTAIGQRADGTVMLVVIDGRQAHSLGAGFKDLIDIFMENGAVNAANLDGGSSSLMVFNDEIISVTASLYGSRKIPTAILVK